MLNSGSTDHVIDNDKYFDNFIELKEPVNIYLGDNRSIKATNIRNVLSYFKAFGKFNEVDIKNVFYSKDMSNNLIGYGKISDNNTIVSEGDQSKIFDKFSKLTTVVHRTENKIYPMKSFLKTKQNQVNNFESTIGLS